MSAPVVARSRGLATFVLVFASFMDLIDGTIVNVALPSIRDDLSASPAQLEWVVGAYLLSFAVLLVTVGPLGVIYGRRRILILGVLRFTFFAILTALAPWRAPPVRCRNRLGVMTPLNTLPV